MIDHQEADVRIPTTPSPPPPRTQEFLHKQTFDQSAAIAALSALAMSGNLDSGGGLALMLESLQRQIALVQGRSWRWGGCPVQPKSP